MSTVASRPLPRRRLWWTVSDAAVVTKRNLYRYLRVPPLLLFSTIQPIMFVLLFTYVFGGAIVVVGVDHYVDYLMAGILVQTVIFGSTQTGVGLAEDMTRGMVDRFRSLPMARSAVLAGRTMSDTARNLFVICLMLIVGTLVGFRFHAGVAAAFGAVGLALAFGLAFSWISAFIGLSVRDVESAQAAGFVWVFPLVFASSAFVPVQTMPSWLQAFAEINPVTVTVDALRALTLGGPAIRAVLQSLAWIAAILLVFVPLAVNRYRRAAG
jgi:ABC-2 type transport system permease protein/oleandomycin transport system permease protein